MHRSDSRYKFLQEFVSPYDIYELRRLFQSFANAPGSKKNLIAAYNDTSAVILCDEQREADFQYVQTSLEKLGSSDLDCLERICVANLSRCF